MADRYLSKEKQKELLQEFEMIEQEKIGVGQHEEFHKLLDQPKSLYLE